MVTAVVPRIPLFADYRRLDATFDEFFGEDGAPRPEVAQLVRALDRIGKREFQKRQQLHPRALMRCEHFFVHLQRIARDWVALGTTKTGTVYRLQGGAPTSRE